jgi:signal transduction histidine kinase
VIDRNANRLLRLIEDLLLLSRLESRTVRLHRAPVRLIDLLGASVSEREPVATAAGVELRRSFGSGPELSGDAARLYLVISNLIANALHFTPRGGRVTVRSRYVDGCWTVEVADTGIGIPATDLPKLFNAFFRGSNVTSAVGRHARPGKGLGLLVCRAIVELHAGAIQVASTEGIGTTVTLTLPVGPERTSEVDRESAACR